MAKKIWLAALLLSTLAAAQAVTSPQAFFGFPMGADRQLADWTQLTAYYQKLAAQSPRVRFAELGKTTEGRPFVLVTISAPENLANLDRYRQIQAQLADPRATAPEQAARLVAQGKTILAITCNIHSNEIASSQTAAQFAYQMATGDTPEIQNILRNTIILLVPSLNPDGEQLVVDWYKKTLGTPYEGSDPVVLYQKYVGHDDNRDWYMFTQPETRLTVEKVLNAWHPQILYDVHQMSATGPRLYLPPWVDPIDPNVDPILVASMNAVGMDTARDLTAEGKTGVLVDGVYDLWSPARQYIVYHAGLRLLTESASVRIATPQVVPFERLGTGIGYDAKVAKWNFPEPWPGGTWTLGDIVAYQLSAFHSIARNAATNREQFLTNFYRIGQRAVAPKANAPYAYILPAAQSDPRATAALVNVLREGAVEVGRAGGSFAADGQSYAAGSYIVRLAQPYGAFAKSLLETQHYPNIREYPDGPPQRPYDVTAQTLPLLLGVRAVAVAKPFDVSAALLEAPVKPAPGHFSPDPAAAGYLFADQSNGSLLALFAVLRQGLHAERLAGSPGVAPGAIYVPQQPGAVAVLAAAAAQFSADIAPAAQAPAGPGEDLRAPRIALYQSWVPQIDEGWTRWIFDQDAIPYARLVDAEIRQGDLRRRFDVIVIPDEPSRSLIKGNPAGRVPAEYAGGIGSAGLANLEAFVRQGGVLLALNQASSAFLPWTGGSVVNVLDGVRNTDFFCPGSILEASVDPANPIAYGAGSAAAIFSEEGPAFKLGPGASSVVTYTADFHNDYRPDDLLLSGWLLGGDRLKGNSALADVPLGQGHLVLYGFKPQYRAQSEVTYRFLFNAMLLGGGAQ